MWTQIDTGRLAMAEKNRLWREGITAAYYQLDMHIPDIGRFRGQLQRLAVPELEISRLQTSPIQYVCVGHSTNADCDAFLLALPQRSHIDFHCQGQHAAIAPGRFLLQHSQLPYTFECPDDIDMWVLKINGAQLRQHCHRPELLCRHAPHPHSERTAFLAEYLPLIYRQLQAHKQPDAHTHLLARHVVELTALLLNESHSVLTAQEDAVTLAHLLRIQHYVQNHLNRSDLTAAEVAQACRISIRYLHLVFQRQGLRFGPWLKELRLQRAHTLLASGHYPFSLAFLASECGFVNTSRFATQFKARFGAHPKEWLGKPRKH